MRVGPEQASVVDVELTAVRRCILSGDWLSSSNPAFAYVENELCGAAKVLLHGDRFVVPSALHARVVLLAHEAQSPRRRHYSRRKCGGQGGTQQPIRCAGRVTRVKSSTVLPRCPQLAEAECQRKRGRIVQLICLGHCCLESTFSSLLTNTAVISRLSS